MCNQSQHFRNELKSWSGGGWLRWGNCGLHWLLIVWVGTWGHNKRNNNWVGSGFCLWSHNCCRFCTGVPQPIREGLQWRPLSMWSLWSDNRNLVNVLWVLELVIRVRYDSRTVTWCLIHLYVLNLFPPKEVGPWGRDWMCWSYRRAC